jgi:hypothetical protein
MKPNDGGPAFPVDGSFHPDKGMTLRDWFAGQALVGIIKEMPTSRPSAENLAREMYEMADAMIVERNKE